MEIVKILPVSFFRELSGNEPARKWLQALPIEDRKRIGRDIGIVQTRWPVGFPVVKLIGEGLWEIRTNLDNRIARTLFIMHEGGIVLLHAFIKKTEKTPPSEIKIAMDRKRSIKLKG